MSLGVTTWVLVDGYIPPTSTGPAPAMISHDTVCILNTGDRDAAVELIVYFRDREPAGPYRLSVPARRTHHQRFNDLSEPEAIPVDTDFSCVVRSDHPVVVQQTRLDSRQSENALMTTIAFPIP
ncbi:MULTISPECIES: sensory rhodopsin transducer [unclassified Mycolicibacterium]|uniref:sensory rhodopsin transducer n=1 Tax=unclassified Mycolicibacterium TaxID=2636767 RepID=UPI002ED85192